MKLQGMSIVFALVCLPIILVIAYYISLQIDTITLQKMYDSKLLDATYDAMSAFELNTANEDLSTVSDSLRTIIEASNNIFMNTLATNLGMSNASKSHIEPYVPSILYTLYDGYYIYAPTYAPTVITDSNGNAVSVGDLGVQQGENGNYNFFDPLTSTTYQDAIEKVAQNKANEADKQNAKTFEEKYTLKVDWEENNKIATPTDYGQLLYRTPFTETITEDGMTKYTNCTTSLNPASSTGSGSVTDAKYKTQNVLKSYIPYSARYVQSGLNGGNLDVDINVIYTLDNYITIDGTFTYAGNNIYYTKSGYLIPFISNEVCVRVYLNGETDPNKALNYNQNEIQEYIEAGTPVRIDILKDLNLPVSDDNSWETIIETKDTIIDATKSNNNSANARLTRYENLEFSLEEFYKKVDNDLFGDISDDEVVNEINNAYNTIKDNFSSEGINIDGMERDAILTEIRERINNIKYDMQLNSAAVYYAKAAIFSNWVKDTLSELKISSIQDISGVGYSTYTETMSGDEDYSFLNMWNDDSSVFDFSEGDNVYGTTEIKKDSSFYNHKLKVIRASIQYNLNLSMSAYNRHTYYADDAENYAFDKNTDYAMPIMSETEWDQILSNISIVSFMQGLNCKMKTYNNYVVVSSSNNEIMTTADNIYYAKKEEFNDGNSEYHTFNCSKIKDKFDKSDTENNEYISFTSKEVKYDKMTTTSTVIPYAYDHKNLACYDCINDSNYKELDIFNSSDEYYNLRKAFYIGIAKERNDIYKMNAVKNSEGFEIIYMGNGISGQITAMSTLNLNQIKEIEVVFGAVNTDRDEASLTFAVEYDTDTILKKQNGSDDSVLYSIPTNTINNYTWKIKVDSNINKAEKFSIGKLYFKLLNEETSSFLEGEPNNVTPSMKLKTSIKEIRIIYK